MFRSGPDLYGGGPVLIVFVPPGECRCRLVDFIVSDVPDVLFVAGRFGRRTGSEGFRFGILITGHDLSILYVLEALRDGRFIRRSTELPRAVWLPGPSPVHWDVGILEPLRRWSRYHRSRAGTGKTTGTAGRRMSNKPWFFLGIHQLIS